MAESQVLKRLDFPAYCVQVLDNGLVAIAGGGGTSKTGVGNSIELGHVNYTTVELASQSGPNSHAQFQSIHTFEPQDAVMKFISFTVDRSSQQGNGIRTNAKTNNKKNKGKNSKNAVDYNDQIIPEFDANKSDLYIAACVNNSIEIYKVQPIIDKHSTNLTSRRTRTNSNSSSSSGHTPVGRTASSPTDANARKRHPSNSLARTVSALPKDASANLILQKSIHIDQIINENEADMILSEPETKTKVTKKLSQSLNANRYDEETINTVAVCQIKTIPGRHRILLCSGTSKGNICVYELIINQSQSSKRNDSNNNGNGLMANNEMPIKCNKLKVFTEAHGKQDVDDLQINNQQSQLLSIGKDNKCIIWSLTPKIEKLTELNYISILGDSNLRMRHGRFAQNGNILYTTYVPRIRGGGRTMNTYIHRWDSSKPTYKVMKTHRIRYTQITSIQASKEGDCLVCGDCEGMIFLFDANFNQLTHFKKQHSSVVTDLAFYHDSNLAYNSNKLILSLSIDRTLQCYTHLDTKQTFGYGPLSFLVSMGGLSSLMLQKISSMNAFKVFMLMSLLVLLFCYFFTFFE